MRFDKNGQGLFMKRLIAAQTIIMLMSTGAFAGDAVTVDNFDLTATTGTLGTGLEANWRLSSEWGVRAGISGGSFSYVYHDVKADLHSRVTLLNAGVTGDYYPGGGDFRFSAGARLSANRIKGEVRKVKTSLNAFGRRINVTIDDPLTTYTATQNPVQPYLGAGYGYNVNNRMRLNLDFGALYTGRPDINVTSHATKLGFSREQIDREISRADRRASAFRFYPVVQFGLKVQF